MEFGWCIHYKGSQQLSLELEALDLAKRDFHVSGTHGAIDCACRREDNFRSVDPNIAALGEQGANIVVNVEDLRFWQRVLTTFRRYVMLRGKLNRGTPNGPGGRWYETLWNYSSK
jgi:hypothetical protein